MAGHHHTDNCKAMLEQLCDYIDGDLAPHLCAEIEQHLENCDDCRVLVDTTRKTVALYRHHGRVGAPAGTVGRLWQALQDSGCMSKKEK